ncbi:MAG: general secretion pathway protein M [Candidatus Electronema aureum]|uniref:General secretion pathway protein M n=1 Tax=Candidatus Electronema aureum TaxID=2005002 RepID=A0A521G0S9_9BACT|nr:MAG: general secretion pathway protein M [Candidatus Electronema aureum]
MRQLSQKDRRALLFCVAALLLFGLFQFVLFPLLDGRKRLERGIANRKKAVAEMQAMQSEIKQFSRQNSSLGERVTQRPESFSLFSFLEKKGEEAKVKDNILYIKPSDTISDEGRLQQVAVEMKLQAVPIDRLVALLELIESPENIVEIERISILTNKKEQGGLDAVMRVVSLMQQAKQGGE